MKIHAINPVYSRSFSMGARTKDIGNHPPITYDVNKTKATLLTLFSLGFVIGTVILIKDAGNNAVKTAFNTVKETAKEVMPDPMITAVGNKRDSIGIKRYNLYKAKTKLKSLEMKMQNGEFKNLPEHAMKNIEKQKAALIKQCTQKI